MVIGITCVSLFEPAVRKNFLAPPTVVVIHQQFTVAGRTDTANSIITLHRSTTTIDYR